jgi:hypothetical protein
VTVRNVAPKQDPVSFYLKHLSPGERSQSDSHIVPRIKQEKASSL